jgi:hypothetical protein
MQALLVHLLPDNTLPLAMTTRAVSVATTAPPEALSAVRADDICPSSATTTGIKL